MASYLEHTSQAATHLTRRLKRQSTIAPAVMISFLVGVVFAALVIPRHAGGANTSVGIGGAQGGVVAGSGNSPLGSTTPNATSGTPLGSSGVKSGSRTVGTVSAGGAGGGPSGSATGGAPGGRASSAVGPTTPRRAGNGGATAPGVTATAVTVGVLGGDSSALQTICPRCGQGGQQTDKDLVSGLLALWTKEGKLPIYGRTIRPTFAEATDLAAETFQSACEQLMGTNPLIAINPAGGSDAGVNCETTQYHVPALEASGATTNADLSQDYPLLWEIGPPLDRVLHNWADWLNSQNLLHGKVLGLYSPADSSSAPQAQEDLNQFRHELKALGYSIKVDYVYNGEGQSDDAVAVTQMRNAGVNEVLVFAALTEPAGFQNAAAQIGYHPLYPMVDAGYSFTDAVAQVSYNAAQENGNLGMAQKWWQWSARSPATPLNNPPAAECVQAYENQTHKALDVYNDDAKIRYLLDECSDLDVMLQAMRNAGPDLTRASFVQGIEQIRNMQVPEYESVSFTTNPLLSGGLYWATAQFKAAHWEPENDYIRITGRWTPWFYTGT